MNDVDIALLCVDPTVETRDEVGREDDASGSTAMTSSGLQLSPSLLSSCGDDRQTMPSKPVAMVQPRKVHGVRVLPSPTSSRLVAGQKVIDAARPSRLARSPAIRAPRPPPPTDETPVSRTSTPRWTGRRLTNPGDAGSCDPRRLRNGRCARRPANHSSASADNHGTANWQCRVSSSSDVWPSVGQLAAVAEGAGSTAGVDEWSPQDHGADSAAAHEALLMTKKKDAEIAALLRHIRLNGMSRDPHHTRRRPSAFNECLIERINFERSLGYYP